MKNNEGCHTSIGNTMWNPKRKPRIRKMKTVKTFEADFNICIKIKIKSAYLL